MAASMQKRMSKTLKEFTSLTQHPEEFLSAHDNAARKFRKTTKAVYDFTKSSELKTDKQKALPELIIDNFDSEQIWQELELQNEAAVTSLLADVAGLVAGKNSLTFGCDRIVETKPKPIEKQKQTIASAEETADVGSESGSDTDSELAKIKSRLKSGGKEDLAENSGSDLDFDFGDLGGLDADSDEEDEDGDDSREENESDKEKESEEEGEEMVKSEKSEKTKTRKSGVSKTSSVVDDKFFKLADMEAFLDREDVREERRKRQEEGKERNEDESGSSDEEEEDIDMFEDIREDEGKSGQEICYEDFFDPPEDEKEKVTSKRKVKFNEELKSAEEELAPSEEDKSDEDDVANSTPISRQKLLSDSESEGEDVRDILGARKDDKSTFEKRQEKLKKKISDMEEASLVQKPWQLLGETSATSRPENSLLEEHLMFEQTTRLAPVITEETTKSLEDVIKQRIKDQAWDDVERKIKPKEDVFEYKKRIVLDQEKSKQSLGEIYEQEFLKQQQNEAPDKVDPDHEEIKKMMQSLFVKLDALSNFHYTPKPSAPEVKIVSNLPSITMEEVAPVTVSDTKMLAPEEIQEKVKGELKGKTEKTVTDRKHERRKKKAEKRARQKDKEKREKLVAKLKPGLGNKYSKEKAMKNLEKQSKSSKGGVTLLQGEKKGKTSLTSSKSFFTQLQDEVSTQISSKKAQKRKKDKSEKSSSKKLKL